MRRLLWVALVCALPVLALAIGEQFGRITGIVYDQDGAEMPHAKVTLTSPALIGGPRVLYTVDDGSFTFNNLPPGKYQLTIEQQGFLTLTQTNLTVSIGKTLTMYKTMEASTPAQPTSNSATQPRLTKDGTTQKEEDRKKYGRISGVLYTKDKPEAPNVELTLTSPLLPEGSRKFYSCEDGFFTFGNLPPGKYQLTIGYPGVKTTKQESFDVKAGATWVLFSQLEAQPNNMLDLINEAECSDQEDNARSELFMNMETFLAWDLISQGLGTVVYEEIEPQLSAIDIDLPFSSNLASIPVFSQELPKKGQSLEEFVVQLPNIEVSEGTLLIKQKPANVVVDGFLNPFSSGAAPVRQNR